MNTISQTLTSLLLAICIALPAHAELIDEMATGSGQATDAPVSNDLINLNAVQSAWTDSDPRANVGIFEYNERTTIKMLLREFMHSTIVLPKGEKILDFTLGDNMNFKAALVDKELSNVLYVWGQHAGADTNLTIFGKSGNIYLFYLRNHSIRSDYVPHLVVYIKDKTLCTKMIPEKKNTDESLLEVASNKTKEKIDGEYLRTLNLPDPSQLNFNYEW